MSPSTLIVSLKLIALRLEMGIKRVNELIARRANDNPLPVEHDRILGWVISEGTIVAWKAAELEQRVSYARAVELGRVKARHAS